MGIIQPQLHAQYRVKTVASVYEINNKEVHSSHTLIYDGEGKLTKITVKTDFTSPKTEDVAVSYDKKKVTLPRDVTNPEVRSFVEFDKENRPEAATDIKLKYAKNNSLERTTYQDSKYDVYYDEFDRLIVLAKSEDHAYENILFFYGETGKLEKVIQGNDFNQINYVPKWTGDRLDLIEEFNVNNELTGKHEFFYDQQGNLVEEKIYKGEKLDKHITVTYESGTGNDKETYLCYNNWFINTFFNQQTFKTITVLKY
jgi:YD repeat-containing protein